MQVRKRQLELDMEQQTGSIQEKEYVKAVYCHPAYLTYFIFKTVASDKTIQLHRYKWFFFSSAEV